uniref:Uncharacterized protein n=1 Tax=Parascaris univalens TaxID=6257 RepID=A0A915C209_PARUN
MELSEAEIAQLKEHNQRRVKRVVAIVAITMTLISIVLVALSLSLGSKIDQLGIDYDKLFKFRQKLYLGKIIG